MFKCTLFGLMDCVVGHSANGFNVRPQFLTYVCSGPSYENAHGKRRMSLLNGCCLMLPRMTNLPRQKSHEEASLQKQVGIRFTL